jgi:hypothetical protein
MITRFEFHAPSSPISRRAMESTQLRRRGSGCASFSIAIEQDGLERDGYGRASYNFMEVSRGPDRLFQETERDIDGSSPRSSLRLDTRRVFRARGTHDGIAGAAAEPSGGALLITLCAFEPQDHLRFLEQFRRAAGFMETQRGFVMNRLFEAVSCDNAGWLVNVARFTGVSAFKAALASPAFKDIIAGGFQTRSQFMLARFPQRCHSPFEAMSVRED